MKAFTDYPFVELGDDLNKIAPITSQRVIDIAICVIIILIIINLQMK